jgi:hypothetical protein
MMQKGGCFGIKCNFAQLFANEKMLGYLIRQGGGAFFIG